MNTHADSGASVMTDTHKTMKTRRSIPLSLLFGVLCVGQTSGAADYFVTHYNAIPNTGSPGQLKMLGTWGYYTNTGGFPNNCRPNEGDEIGAFWHNGTTNILVGAATVSAGAAADGAYATLNMFGRCSEHPEGLSYGLTNGAPVTFRVYLPDREQEFTAQPTMTFQGGSLYFQHDLAVWHASFVFGAGRFVGGTHDGWDTDQTVTLTYMGGPPVRLSSGVDQVLDARMPAVPLQPITIQESEQPWNRGLKAGHTMTLAFPPGLNPRWDIGAYGYGGTAIGHVEPPFLVNGDRELRIPITGDFATADTLVISGLRATGLPHSRQGSGRLRLDYDGDGVWNVFDEQRLTLRIPWPGGSCDGWDTDQTPSSRMLLLRGSVIQFQ